MLPESFKEVSGVFQGSFRESSKGVLRKFQGGSNEVEEHFK